MVKDQLIRPNGRVGVFHMWSTKDKQVRAYRDDPFAGEVSA
jgi:hypothetical protein